MTLNSCDEGKRHPLLRHTKGELKLTRNTNPVLPSRKGMSPSCHHLLSRLKRLNTNEKHRYSSETVCATGGALNEKKRGAEKEAVKQRYT
jgi:hypothetical protein